MGKIGLEYSCSVWDTTSAKEIASLNPILIKVGSPSNQHWELQKVLRDEYEGEVHISTGMTTKEEIEKIVKFWEEGKGDAKNRVVLYNCTDHAASLEPAGLSRLVRDLKATHTSMTYKPTEILDLEKEQRAKLKWGQYNKSILDKSK